MGLAILNVHSGWDILRIACGLFFIPHVYGKFFVPAALGFFKAAGFKPPAFWMYVAGAVETVLTVLLVAGVYPLYVGSVAAFHLCIAAIGVAKVSGGKWLWNIGGVEYPVFWALCCALVAAQG